MGKSYTVHCVGIPEGLAMSRLEIVQAERKAAMRGRHIEYWFAQTKVGERILGGPRTRMEDVPNLPRVVVCPICGGDGHNGPYQCPVCRGSGVCRPNAERNFMPWQLEHMKAERRATSA